VQLALKFRNMLPTVVREELDGLVATISGFWDVEHKANGSHGDIHVDSITVGGIPIIPAAGGGTGGSGSGGMEYLGDYRAGPAYHDGDIVVAADGIAYVCVVDGTTTPPEPWPGGGVAVNATVDATYWVVSPHGALTNERVMSSLANGYVKATLGEPSTVAQIPITDGGTGAGTPAAARTNLGVGNVGTLNLNGNAAQYLDGTGAWTTPPQSAGVPSGAIVFFVTPCPPGYTRIAGWDGRYVRMNGAYGSGGAASHSHGPGTYAAPTHTHGVGTLASPSHSHGGGTLSVAAHSHSVPNTDTAGNHAHSFTAQTDVESNGSGIMDAGGNQNCTRAAHTHGVSGNTNTTGDHFHTMGNTGNANPGITGGATQGVAATITGATAASGALGVTGASDAQSNLPLYVDFFACQKD